LDIFWAAVTDYFWFGDKDKLLSYEPKDDEMLITVHRWFANKSCPGNWIYARLGDLAEKVTERLGGGAEKFIPSGMQARKFQNLTEAQFILESGYGKSDWCCKVLCCLIAMRNLFFYGKLLMGIKKVCKDT
jgi:hypothetical protein